jgi:multidrug resistance efflux pump
MTQTPEHDEPDTAADKKPAQDASGRGMDPVRKWTLITGAIIVALLVWYLSADRYTPFTTQARVEAYVIPIAPQVTGNIMTVNVVNNQLVNKNDELLRLDETQYTFAVDKARADLESAKQQYGASAAAVDSAAAAVETSRANLTKAQQEAERLERIYKEDSGAISLRRLQIAQASLTGAESQVVGAKAELVRARQQMGQPGDNNAGVQAARAALENAELDLQRTRILAPDRGLVTDLQVDAGNLAQTGQPLMTFVTINDVWLQADFRENNLGHIKPGAPVEISLDVQPGRIFRGRVRSIGYGVSSGNDSALGGLPTVENDRNWLRDAQRFPIIIELEPVTEDESLGLRVGAQATVMIFTEDSFLLVPFGKLYMRLVALASYAY